MKTTVGAPMYVGLTSHVYNIYDIFKLYNIFNNHGSPNRRFLINRFPTEWQRFVNSEIDGLGLLCLLPYSRRFCTIR